MVSLHCDWTWTLDSFQLKFYLFLPNRRVHKQLGQLFLLSLCCCCWFIVAGCFLLVWRPGNEGNKVVEWSKRKDKIPQPIASHSITTKTLSFPLHNSTAYVLLWIQKKLINLNCWIWFTFVLWLLLFFFFKSLITFCHDFRI